MTKETDKKETKLYKFESVDNPYLYVAGVKAQFIDGYYETSNKEVAKIVANVCDVRQIK